jgi:hypothetical protein
MDINTLREIDELIALIDKPCECADSSCPLCHIMDLLWSIRDDIAPGVSLVCVIDQTGNSLLH